MSKKYGLLGHPLGHSFSRKFHNERFASLGIDAFYENFDLESISMLPDVLASEQDLCGLNVTIPYKQQVMAYLDELDSVAQRIGAVNTVCIHRVSSSVKSKLPGFWLIGRNTDIIGFRDTILPLLDKSGIMNQSDRRALILGTGGASKAVKVALEDLGFITSYVSRSSSQDRISYQELTSDIIAQHKVIVNCSPVGMYPHIDEAPAIPYEYLTPNHVCYDLIYNPSVTQFLAKAQAKGALTMSGGAMLEGQAIASYNYWTTE